MIGQCVIGAPKAIRDFIATVDVQGEDSMTATKKRAVKKVKTSKRTGKVTRNKVTLDDVVETLDRKANAAQSKADRIAYERDILVHEIEMENLGFFGHVGYAAGAVTSGVIGAVRVTLDTILDSLAVVGKAVWTFLGKVFDSAFAFCGAVLRWVGDAILSASGKTREALVSVRERISSMNVDWVAVNSNLVKFMVAAAALGVGVTAGIMVGTVTAGLAATGLVEIAGVGFASAAWYGKVVGLIFAALSAGVVADVIYTLGMAGVEQRVLAAALNDAKAKNAARLATA